MWPMRFQASSASALSRCSLLLMILMPCSFSHATYRPDRDHLIALMVPSPECKTVSLPVLVPNPIDPSHPDAAAVALVVVEVLRPGWPPTVRIRFPASPPERYVRSFL